MAHFFRTWCKLPSNGDKRLYVTNNSAIEEQRSTLRIN